MRAIYISGHHIQFNSDIAYLVFSPETRVSDIQLRDSVSDIQLRDSVSGIQPGDTCTWCSTQRHVYLVFNPETRVPGIQPRNTCIWYSTQSRVPGI